jgi:HK97 gp10 family phage protein
MTVEWHGRKILARVKSATWESEETTAKKVEAEAKRLCPVLKGEKQGRTAGLMRDAIKAEKANNVPGVNRKYGWVVWVPAGNSPTFYSRWVELGTKKRVDETWQTAGHAHPVPRQPFLRPALEKERKAFWWRLKSNVNKKLI